MIDLASETLLPLGGVPALLPPGPRGKPIHVATVYRWSAAGVRGAVLETVVIGGCRYTSREALSRFIDATTAASRPVAIQTPARRASLRRAQEALRLKRSEAAAARLAREGC